MAAATDSRTGKVTVKVDGKDWSLLCDFNALCIYTDATGEDGLDAIEQLQAGTMKDPRKIRLFVHCALIQCHPEATLQDAGRILTVAPDALGHSVDAAFPVPEDEAEEPSEPGEATAAQD